jgi:hypothetical protein
MKKLNLMLIFLFATAALLLLPQVSLAAVYHPSAQQKVQHAAYSPGTTYYSFSSIATTGSTAGTIGAVNLEGGLTLHINADGTFIGTIVVNPSSIANVVGSFQSDGSIQFNVLRPFTGGSVWQGTAQPQKNGEFVGTFTISNVGITLRSGSWAIVPVQDPTQVTAFDVSAIISAGPDQGMPYGGVVILDQSGVGTFRTPYGNVVPVTAQISQGTITIAFSWNNVQLVTATGTSSTIGTVVKYTGTFVGPRSGDSGNWTGYPFTFAS